MPEENDLMLETGNGLIETEEARAERIQQYDKVVEHISLSSIKLVDMKFSVAPEFFAKKNDRKLSFFIPSDEDEYEIEIADHDVIVRLKFSAKAEVDEKICYRVEADYLLFYSLNEKCLESAIKNFIMRVAKFTIYPYFRALAATINGQAEINLPPLPILK